MIVGMDFGTTNSGMAVYDGRAVRVLPLDPSNTNPRVLPTAVYITNEQAVTIGRAAIDLYYQHNIGRAVKLRKIWVGELEVFGGCTTSPIPMPTWTYSRPAACSSPSKPACATKATPARWSASFSTRWRI